MKDKKHEEPRKKAHKRPKRKTSRNRTPQVTEKTKKRKRKQSIVSSDYAYGSENTRNTSYVTDDVQPEPKSILNPSKRAGVIQFDDTKR